MPVLAPARPGFMRMNDGRLVPMSKPFGWQAVKEKKFLIVLQFYDGDRAAAEELAFLIADLERTRNHEADIMLFCRADSRELSSTAQDKLKAKFDQVINLRCRRTGMRGYPAGCNEMFYDLVSVMSQVTPYKDDYYAFINLEPDAVPTRPGWIGELIAYWKAANAEGKAAIGFIEGNPVPHMNGLAVYAADIWHRVGNRYLTGGSLQVCYDIFQSKRILPLAKETPLIFFHYRHSTVTPEEVFARQKDGIEPAIFHGVKDGSARAAVRARHITLTATQTKRPNVYTYYHQLIGQRANDTEVQAILDLWRQGWTSRGWNPVILTFKDAQKHARFAQFEAAVNKLPCAISDRKRWEHQFYRWLALDSAGGGLLTDYDALPDQFSPVGLDLASTALFSGEGNILAMKLNKENASLWVEEILKYDAQPTDTLGNKPHVTDFSVAANVEAFKKAIDRFPPIIHFGSEIIGNERKSVAMERFLAAK